MITETTGRNEIQMMQNKYNAVIRWEEQFANEIEELKKIDENDTEANSVALELLKTWDDRSKISGKRTALVTSSNSRKIDKLESKLNSLGYNLKKTDWNNNIAITKLKCVIA
jgi:chaperonin cofactor prefoldin